MHLPVPFFWMIAKNERLNVDSLNSKLAFSKFISNKNFSLDWKQVAKSTLLLQNMTVVLFDTAGISRCRSQNVSVESSSLLHHSIYLWFICFTWWSIDELENLHADRTTVYFEPWQKLRARLGTRKTGLSPPVSLYWPFQGGTSVVVPYCSCCLCLYFGSSIMLVTYFVNFR